MPCKGKKLQIDEINWAPDIQIWRAHMGEIVYS